MRSPFLPYCSPYLWRLVRPPTTLSFSHLLSCFGRSLTTSISICCLGYGDRRSLPTLHPFAQPCLFCHLRMLPLPLIAPRAMCCWVAAATKGRQILQSVIRWIMVKMVYHDKAATQLPGLRASLAPVTVTGQCGLSHTAKAPKTMLPGYIMFMFRGRPQNPSLFAQLTSVRLSPPGLPPLVQFWPFGISLLHARHYTIGGLV